MQYFVCVKAPIFASKVPYLASSLWLSGSPPPGDDALKALLTPAPPPLLEKYLSLSEDLALELPSPGTTNGGGRGQKRTPEMSQRSNSRNRAAEAGPLPEKRAKVSSGFVEADTKEVWGPTGVLGKVQFRCDLKEFLHGLEKHLNLASRWTSTCRPTQVS